MKKLKESGTAWKILSGDRGILDTAHERAALLESGLTYFVCDHAWHKNNAMDQAWKLVKLWKEIVRHAEAPDPGLYRLCTGRKICVEVIQRGTQPRTGRFKS